MEKSVKVSIVVPVYNGGVYLKKCLDTLSHQTLEDIQIICVDDHSTDDSWAVLESYAQKDPRIQIFKSREGQSGAGQARNRGMEEVSGKYFLVLDCDDYFDLDLAKKTYEKAEETNSDIVIYDAQYVTYDSEQPVANHNAVFFHLFPEKEVFSPKDVSEVLFQMVDPMAWKQLYRSAFVREQKIQFQNIKLMNDIYFTYCTLLVATRISSVKEQLLYYRFKNPTSLINNPDKDPLAPIHAFLPIKTFLEDRGLFERFHSSYLHRILNLFLWFLPTLHQPESYEKLYEYLRRGGLEEIGCPVDMQDPVYEKIPPINLRWIKTVKNQSFLTHAYKGYIQQPACIKGLFEYSFPESLVKPKEKILLYGAGLVGRCFYAQNVMCDFCDIVAWVDGNHENLPTVVQGKACIKQLEYDKVLIAVENKRVQKVIQEELQHLGVEETKIVCV